MDLRDKNKEEILVYVDKLKTQIETPLKQAGEDYKLKLHISNSLFQIINPMKSEILGMVYEVYFEDNLLMIENVKIDG